MCASSCLREIGYTDAFLDARASRIRHLRNITGHPSEPTENTSIATNNRQARSEATEAVCCIVYAGNVVLKIFTTFICVAAIIVIVVCVL